MRGLWAILAALNLVTVALPQALPTFEQYKAAKVYSGKPAHPVLRTPDDRQFRTRIREAAAEGPNFAGHYTIAAWGCGAGCVQTALIDAVDGRIYRTPFQVLGWQLVQFEGRLASNDDHFEPLDFHKDSRLLIARGCPEETNCGSYFYELEGARFKLIRKIAAVPIPPK